MTVHDVVLLNIAQAVCKRPRLFTPNGILSEVVAFLAGCEYGVTTAYANDNSPKLVVQWLLRDVTADNTIEPIDRLSTAINRYDSTDAGLAAIYEFATKLANETNSRST